MGRGSLLFPILLMPAQCQHASQVTDGMPRFLPFSSFSSFLFKSSPFVFLAYSGLLEFRTVDNPFTSCTAFQQYGTCNGCICMNNMIVVNGAACCAAKQAITPSLPQGSWSTSLSLSSCLGSSGTIRT